MESPAPSSTLRVRYGLRSTFSPLLLSGSLAELSGLWAVAGIMLFLGVILTGLIAVRPYLEMINGEAHYVGLITGRRWLVSDIDALLSVKSLRWFVRGTDMEQLRVASGRS